MDGSENNSPKPSYKLTFFDGTQKLVCKIKITIHNSH